MRYSLIAPSPSRAVAIDHGIMNLVGTSLGGVPMCHGAGGMAAHIRFGARTGGALVILGGVVLFIGLFLGDSVATLFKLFPPALLGVILMFGGLELAAGVHGNNSVRRSATSCSSPQAWRCGTWVSAMSQAWSSGMPTNGDGLRPSCSGLQ